MDHLKKIASGFVRSGVLTAGLFGLYYFHKRQIPEYMGFISFCITCVGIYAMSTFILEDEYEDSEEDKDQEPKPVQVKRVQLTPTLQLRPTRTRRLLVIDESETKKSLEKTEIENAETDAKKRKSKEVQAEISAKILKLSKADDKDEKKPREKRILRFQEPDVITRESNVAQQISKIEEKVPDIINEKKADSKAEINRCLEEIVDKLESGSAQS